MNQSQIQLASSAFNYHLVARINRLQNSNIDNKHFLKKKRYDLLHVDLARNNGILP